jgi:hypothetical protein
MILDEISFEWAEIVEVKETTADYTIDFTLEFPIEETTDSFKTKVIRFKEAIVYIKKEIPSLGQLSIIEIKQLGSLRYNYKDPAGKIKTSKYKIEIVTNAGIRLVEFNEVEIFDF